MGWRVVGFFRSSALWPRSLAGVQTMKPPKIRCLLLVLALGGMLATVRAQDMRLDEGRRAEYRQLNSACAELRDDGLKNTLASPTLGNLPSALGFTYSIPQQRLLPLDYQLTPLNVGSEDPLTWTVATEGGCSRQRLRAAPRRAPSGSRPRSLPQTRSLPTPAWSR